MGSTRDHTIRALAAIAAIGLTLGACSGRGTEDASEDMDAAAPAATEAASGELQSADDAGPRAAVPQPATDEELAGDEARADADTGSVGGLILPDDAQLAIEASAQLRVDDVRRTVDQVRTAVAAAGGRVASASIAYSDDGDESGGDDVTLSSPTEEAYALLTLLVPPESLGTVVDRLEELGELARFDQLAEDVTDQLTDLDARIANARASVERARELLDQATNLQDLVFLEGELTRRETDLELLLAQQQQLTDRVAMSTLTLEITEQAAAADSPASGGGILDALGDGWDAFATAVLTIVVALAAAAPFLLTLAVALLGFLSVRRWRRHGPGPEAVGAEHPVGDAAVGEGEGRPEAGVGVGVGEHERS